MPFQKVKFKDFSPDLASTTPDILTSTQWMWSVSEGVWECLPAPSVQAALPTGTRCLGAFQGVANTTQMAVFGTSQQLFTWSGSTFTSANLSLTGSATNPWNFTIYGNDLLATNGVDPIQVSTSGGSFGALGGSPPVSSIVAASDFSLFAIPANTNTWYSTLTDTNWSPNIGTQVVTASLTSTPGVITACKALRAGIMMYKQSSCFFGSFTGPPFFWSFAKVSGEHGTWAQGSVVSIGEMHYIVGNDDFYQCDGYTMTPIPNKLRRWFFNTADQTRFNQIKGYHDHPHDRIVWHFASTTAAAGVLDTVIHYSLKTGYWSMDTLKVDCPLDGTFPAGTAYTLTQEICAYVDSGHFLNYINGTSSLNLGSITSYDLGNQTDIYRIRRVQPVFPIGPPAGGSSPPNPPTMSLYSTYVYGQPPLLVRTVPFSTGTGFFDIVSAGRLQRLKINMLSGQQIAEMNVDMEPQGTQ